MFGTQIPVIYSEKHRLHTPEIVEYGTNMVFECAERVTRILNALNTPEFPKREPNVYGREPIERVHSPELLSFYENIWATWCITRGTPLVIPDTFYMRNLAKRKPKDLTSQVGYWCFDRVTPITRTTFEAALYSAYCAITGADLLLSPTANRIAYALCRPPGHHAAADLYGGWCFLNNAAIAAKRLSEYDAATNACSQKRKVAVLDIDYHHGNGTQDIFYNDPNILYASIHADPETGGEPHFIGFSEEQGEGDGHGYNLNLPLPPKGVESGEYLQTLDRAIEGIEKFQPSYLVVSLGCDGMVDDPVGSWRLPPECFRAMGAAIAALNIPTLVVQEGGYNLDLLGPCVRSFLLSFISAPADCDSTAKLATE
jgi:acetoin utilization deacetylase AcuC-like enzyme